MDRRPIAQALGELADFCQFMRSARISSIRTKPLRGSSRTWNASLAHQCDPLSAHMTPSWPMQHSIGNDGPRLRNATPEAPQRLQRVLVDVARG